MWILDEPEGSDTELLTYAMTLINKVNMLYRTDSICGTLFIVCGYTNSYFLLL